MPERPKQAPPTADRLTYGDAQFAVAKPTGDAESDPLEREVILADGSVVERYYARIQLAMKADAVNFERVEAQRAAVLFDHYPGKPIGVILSAWIDEDAGQAKARVRFRANDTFTTELLADIDAGRLPRGLSVGIEFDQVEVTQSETRGEPDFVDVQKWTLLEVSYVAVPAIVSAGMSAEAGNVTAANNQTSREVNTMPATEQLENVIPDGATAGQVIDAHAGQFVDAPPALDGALLTYAEHTTSPNTPNTCLLYTSPSPRDRQKSRMPSSA